MATRVSLFLIWGVVFLSYGSALGIPTRRPGSVVYDSGDFLRMLDPRTTPINTRITERVSAHSEKLINSGSRRSSFRNSARSTSQAGPESSVFKMRRNNRKQTNQPSVLGLNSRDERIVNAQPKGSTRNLSQLRASRVLVQPQGLAMTPRGGISPNITRSRTRGNQRIRMEPTLQARKIRYSRNSTHINNENDTLRTYVKQLKNNYTNPELSDNPYKARNSSYRYDRTLLSAVQQSHRIHEPTRYNASATNNYRGQNNLHQVKNKTQIELLITEIGATRTNRNKDNASPDLTVDKQGIQNVPLASNKSKTQSSFPRHRALPPMSLSHTRQSHPPGVSSLDLPESVRIRMEELRRKLFSRRLTMGSREANKLKRLRGVTSETLRVPSTSTEKTTFSFTTMNQTEIHTVASTPETSTTTPSTNEPEILVAINGFNNNTNTSTDKPAITITPESQTEATSIIASEPPDYDYEYFYTDDELMAMIDTTTEMSLDTVIISNNSKSLNDINNSNVTITSDILSTTHTYKNNSLSNNTKEYVIDMFTSSPQILSIDLDDTVNKTVTSKISTSSFTASTLTTVHVSFGNVNTTTTSTTATTSTSTTETSPTTESSPVITSATNALHMPSNEPLSNFTIYEESTIAKIAITPIDNYFTDRNMSVEMPSIKINSTLQKPLIMYNESKDELDYKIVNTNTTDGADSPLNNISTTDSIGDKQHNTTKLIQETENLHRNHQMIKLSNTKSIEAISLPDVTDQLSNSNKFLNADEIAYINKTGLMVGGLQNDNTEYSQYQHTLLLQANTNSPNISTERNDLQGSDSILIRVETAVPHQNNFAQSSASQNLYKDPVKQKIDNLSASYLYLLSDPLVVEINARPSTHIHQNEESVSTNTKIELDENLSRNNNVNQLESAANTSVPEINVNELIAVKEESSLKIINVDNNQTSSAQNVSQNMTQSEISLPFVEKEPFFEVQQSLSHSVSVSEVRIESHSVVSKVSSHRGVKKLHHEVPFLIDNHASTTPDPLALVSTEKPISPHGKNPFGINPFGNAPTGLTPFGENPFGQNPGGQPQVTTIPIGLLNSKANDSEVIGNITNTETPDQVEKPSEFHNGNDIDMYKNNGNLSPDNKVGIVVDEFNQSSFHLERKRADGTIEGEVGRINHRNNSILNGLRYEAADDIPPEYISYGLELWRNFNL